MQTSSCVMWFGVKAKREIALCFPQVLPAVVDCSEIKSSSTGCIFFVLQTDLGHFRGILLIACRPFTEKEAVLVGGVRECVLNRVPQLLL